jgi:ribosomal protein S18 acetylase RimI-like enzyme
MRIDLRRLVKEDAHILQSARLSALRESPEAFLVTHAEVAHTPLSQVEAELADPDICYLGAFSDGGLLGFMRFVRFQRHSRRHAAEVRSVYVDSSARGQGIASSLLHELIREAKLAGLETLILSVLEDNQAARRLYESCGFQRYGQEPRAIAKGDARIDQVLYALDIRV